MVGEIAFWAVIGGLFGILSIIVKRFCASGSNHTVRTNGELEAWKYGYAEGLDRGYSSGIDVSLGLLEELDDIEEIKRAMGALDDLRRNPH